MIVFRTLSRAEIQKVWAIDRREVIDYVYFVENGSLVLKPEYYDMQGWPPGAAEHYTPILTECFDRGGWFCGAFAGDTLAGVAILENNFIGPAQDQLQLKFLHVSRDFRQQGLGEKYFELAREKARALGARRLYISATPSENTINFYLKLGAVATSESDPDLFELEPEDIHLEYLI